MKKDDQALSDRAMALIGEVDRSTPPNASSEPTGTERSPPQTHASPDQETADLNPSQTQSPGDDPESEEVRLKKTIKNKMKKEKKKRKKAEAATSTISSTPELLNPDAEGELAKPPQHIETSASKPETDTPGEDTPHNEELVDLAKEIISLATKNAQEAQEKYTSMLHLGVTHLPEFLRRYENEVGTSTSKRDVRGKSTHQSGLHNLGGDAFPHRTGGIESVMKQKHPGVTYLRASDLPEFFRQVVKEHNPTDGEKKEEDELQSITSSPTWKRESADNEDKLLEGSTVENQQKEEATKSSSKKRRKKKKKEKNPHTLSIQKASSHTDDDEPKELNEQILQVNDSTQDLSFSNMTNLFSVGESSTFNPGTRSEVVSENASALPFEPNFDVKVKSPSKIAGNETFESRGFEADRLSHPLTMKNENESSLKHQTNKKLNSEDELSRSEKKREEERTAEEDEFSRPEGKTGEERTPGNELPSEHPSVSAKTMDEKEESFAEEKCTRSPKEKEEGEEERTTESKVSPEHPSVFTKIVDGKVECTESPEEKEEGKEERTPESELPSAHPSMPTKIVDGGEESTKSPEKKEEEEERTPTSEIPPEHPSIPTEIVGKKQESLAEEESTKPPEDEEEILSSVLSHEKDEIVIRESDSAHRQDSPILKEVTPKLEHINKEKICSQSSFERVILSSPKRGSPSRIRNDETFYFQRQSAGDTMSLDDGNLLADYSDTNSLHPPYIDNAEEDYDELPSNDVWQDDFMEESSPGATSPLPPLKLSLPTPGEKDDDDDDDAFSFTTSPTYLDSVNEVIYLYRTFIAPKTSATTPVPQVPHHGTTSTQSTTQQLYQPPTLHASFAKSSEQMVSTGTTPNTNQNFHQASTSSSQINSVPQQKGHTAVPVSEPKHESPKVDPKCSESSITKVKDQIISGAIRQSARQSVLAVLPSFHRKTLEMADHRIRDALNRVFSSVESEANSSEHESGQQHEEKYDSEEYSTPPLPPLLNGDRTKNEYEDYVEKRHTVSAGYTPAVHEDKGEDTFSACYARVHSSAIVDASRLAGENKHVMLVTAKSKEVDVMEELRNLGIDSKILETDRTSSYPASGNILVACDSPQEIEQLKNVIKISSKLTVLV